ncbi:hypothetical protein PR048_001066 [Dryococelus australis]|uniref:Uncharacterized protein n=1 Tax=Dryococelus australis TaxID=614101 RepID=A0ABQ9IGB4_9NEOP|nr:hypothetical protein PR048_001066 [Dryococelus australis]
MKLSVDNGFIRRCVGCYRVFTCDKDIAKSMGKDVNRCVWCKEWLQKREAFSHINLLSDLKVVPKDWYNYLRMDEETY